MVVEFRFFLLFIILIIFFFEILQNLIRKGNILKSSIDIFFIFFAFHFKTGCYEIICDQKDI